MNISEKILSQKIGREVIPGEIIEVDVDLAMSHDGTSPPAIKTFEKISDKVWDNEKIVIVFDHNVPANTIGSAEFQKVARNFIKTQGIKNHYIHGQLRQEPQGTSDFRLRSRGPCRLGTGESGLVLG